MQTAPDRVKTYLENGIATGRLPFSCTLFVLNEAIDDCLRFTARSLKCGAGVKVIIDKNFRLPGKALGDLEVYLDESHPDWYMCEAYEREYVTSKQTQYAHVIQVEDSMEGEGGIIASWSECWHAMREGFGVSIDLSKLRKRDSENSNGLVASGPIYFARLYLAIAQYAKDPTMLSLLQLLGTLNEVILRGGYKRGIVTSAIHSSSPYATDYLNAPLYNLKGSHKKGIIVTDDLSEDLVNLIIEKVNTESVFLQKCFGDELYANVCQGIILGHLGTCLIWRVNLGMCLDHADIISSFREATRLAIECTVEWRKHSVQQIWAQVENDRQVAVDVMGFANMLRMWDIKYDDFIYQRSKAAILLYNTLKQAYKESTIVADETCDRLGVPRFDRLHCVEPAQAHAYRELDAGFYTVCRGIWPPFDRNVTRQAERNSVTVDHGPVEIARDIMPQGHFDLCALWQTLFDRPHAISYDTWQNFTVEHYNEWLRSPLETVYYNFADSYNQDFARKRVVRVPLCACEE